MMGIFSFRAQKIFLVCQEKGGNCPPLLIKIKVCNFCFSMQLVDRFFGELGVRPIRRWDRRTSKKWFFVLVWGEIGGWEGKYLFALRGWRFRLRLYTNEWNGEWGERPKIWSFPPSLFPQQPNLFRTRSIREMVERGGWKTILIYELPLVGFYQISRHTQYNYFFGLAYLQGFFVKRKLWLFRQKGQKIKQQRPRKSTNHLCAPFLLKWAWIGNNAKHGRKKSVHLSSFPVVKLVCMILHLWSETRVGVWETGCCQKKSF